MSIPNTPPETLEIRELRGEEEARRCAELMTSCEPWITLQRTYEDALALLTDPSREICVGLVDLEIVGFAILIVKGILVGFVQTLAVAPAWRGRGIGAALMGHAENRILRDSPNVFLCVSSFNERAQGFYEHLGYRAVGELSDFIVRGHSEILMRKTTAPWSEFDRRPKGRGESER